MSFVINLETLLSILLFLFLLSSIILYYQNFLLQRISEITYYENKINRLHNLQKFLK